MRSDCGCVTALKLRKQPGETHLYAIPVMLAPQRLFAIIEKTPHGPRLLRFSDLKDTD